MSLSNFIQDCNQKIEEYKSLKVKAISELKEIQEQDRLQVFQEAVSSNPVNWTEVLRTNEFGDILKEQDDYLKRHVEPVKKIVEFSRGDFFRNSNQLSCHLKLITYHKKYPAPIDKVIPVLIPIIRGLIPVQVHADVKHKFKIIPVTDKYVGEKYGTFSILIDEQNLAYVYREFRLKPEFITSKTTLKEALIYLSKKHPFYVVK
jgi:hypothetical protein